MLIPTSALLGFSCLGNKWLISIWWIMSLLYSRWSQPFSSIASVTFPLFSSIGSPLNECSPLYCLVSLYYPQTASFLYTFTEKAKVAKYSVGKFLLNKGLPSGSFNRRDGKWNYVVSNSEEVLSWWKGRSNYCFSFPLPSSCHKPKCNERRFSGLHMDLSKRLT